MDATVVPLALLDGYKVRWSRETVARDVVQNFFDAAADFDHVSIDVDEQEGTVRVAGRATFDLDYLRYIGATSKQGQRAAGGFGEGFKICALVLLRDYRVEVRAGSGAWEIRPTLRPMKLGRELCYELIRRDDAPLVSWVSITGADAALCKAFLGARDFFRHPENPRLARPLHVDEAAGIGVYFAHDPKRGDVFYRRQHRGAIAFPRGAALTFACDDHAPGVEADRDRRGLRAPGRVAAAVLSRVPTEVLERILRHLRPYWQKGNAALGAALREAARRGARFTFPPRWIASDRHDYHLEEHAKRRGCLVAVSAFAGVGMATAADRFGAVELPRAPSAVEAARIAVARELYEALLGEPPPARRARVTEVVERFVGSSQRSLTLRAAVLRASFEDGVGDVLSVLARQAGDAARHNAERLTKLIEGVLRDPARLGAFRDRWEQAAELPEGAAPEGDEGDDAEEDGDRRAGAARVRVAILAPRGFPPADDIVRRLRALTRSIRVSLWIVRPAVEGPEDAAHAYARGVPSVWIGGVEIEPPRGRPRYALRTFASAAGPRLTPSDEALGGALRAIAARGGGRLVFDTKRERLGRSAHLRWLRAHDPERHRERVIADAVKRALDALDAPATSLGDYQAWMLASQAARRAVAAGLAARGDWEAALDATAAEEVARSIGHLEALERAIAPHLADASPEEQGQLRVHLFGGAKEAAEAVDVELVVQRSGACAAPAARLFAAARDLPVDEACKGACRASAVRLLIARAISGAPIASAAVAADERLAAAADIALERHQGGLHDDKICKGLAAELSARFDASSTQAGGPEHEQAAGAAVRAAWEAAIAAGLSELEAAGRCLEVAEAAAREAKRGTIAHPKTGTP